jgi:Tfp pilus assembly protein PilN
MRRSGARSKWLGVVADATGASAFAVREGQHDRALIAQCRLEYDTNQLVGEAGESRLRLFVQENGLRGCPVHLRFVGSGTVVQVLQLPPMSSRNRARAVHTRLTSYAGGRQLIVDTRVERGAHGNEVVHVLAAGVDRCLARGLCRVFRMAGLRPASVTGLATTFQAPSDQGRVVQLVLAERTTTIQLFEDGRLISCRDVLLGRRDLIIAYQRPILAEHGPVTLSAEQAEQLSQVVGVPVAGEDEVLPGVRGRQLWPLLTPVLQRLRNEVEQTLAHTRLVTSTPVALKVLSLPVIPGVAEYVSRELKLGQSPVPTDLGEATYLAALCRQPAGKAAIDLRPSEERFVASFRKPALAACVAALLIILGNSAGPRQARARLEELASTAAVLQAQLHLAQEQRTATQQSLGQFASELQSRTRLSAALPPAVPSLGALKALFRSVPAGTQLLEVNLEADTVPATLTVRADYVGDAEASVTAAQWARQLADSVFFSDAEVTAVTGYDDGNKAALEIRALVRGG